MRRIILLSLFLLSFVASAQESPEVISVANISRLQSVTQVDFADFDADFDTGMFWMDDSANYIVWQTKQGYPVRLRYLESWSMARAVSNNARLTIIGYAFENHDDLIFSLYQHDGRNYINDVEIQLTETLLDFWTNRETSLFVETMDDGGQLVIWEYLHEGSQLLDTEPIEHRINFEEEDVVRIGRIPLPYTVTSSLEGIVKFWNLQTGETLYEVDNGTGLPSVFGAINTPPTHLVWRDNGNEALYLLNFATGENRRIADLNGEYAQWYFLSPDATVILAVNLGFEPNIVAWDVSTGEKTILGEYRSCNRPQPDMARLSSDGTTLVIGCDTGLDIWRIIN